MCNITEGKKAPLLRLVPSGKSEELIEIPSFGDYVGFVNRELALMQAHARQCARVQKGIMESLQNMDSLMGVLLRDINKALIGGDGK